MFRLTLGFAALGLAGAETVAAVYNPATDQFSVAPLASLDAPAASGEVARCRYEATFLETGWDVLQTRGLEGAADELQARGAGFCEGYMTALSIEQHSVNIGATTYQPSEELQQYLDLNEQWMDSQQAAAAAHGSPEQRTYWWQVHLVREQLDGLSEGYLASPYRKLPEPLTEEQVEWVSLHGDLEDLEGLYAAPAAAEVVGDPTATHCSALVRLLDGNADLLVGQVTWTNLQTMMRSMKSYDANYELYPGAGERVAARASSFSSHPAALLSTDDIYELSSGLVVLETTIGNTNADLHAFVGPGTVLEWIRNVVANRLASSAPSWASWFERYNSGTYNNMQMAVDLNLFVPGQPLAPETMLIVEQVPGFVVTTDVSEVLQRDGYWGSYNVAYDPFVREISGVNEEQQTYGEFFDYWKTARAQIFARDAAGIESLADMKRMMRYNDAEKDPLSSQMPTCEYMGVEGCNPSFSHELTVSTRCDLNPASNDTIVYGISSYDRRNHVGTDAKIVVASEFDAQALPMHAICGPTNDQQPTFVWSESPYADVVHEGHPDVFDFEWQEYSFA